MRIALKLLAKMPDWLAYGVARLLFVILFYVVRYRRSTVDENLRCALPDKTNAERAVIAREFYRHFCDLILEVLRSTEMSQEAFAQRVTFTNIQSLEEATQGFQGQAIVLLIHQGNWEWVLHAAMAKLPIPVDPVYKPLHSEFWDAFILQARSRFGASPIPMAKVGRDVIRKRRQARLIAMLADQTGPKHGGYWTQFLNRPASFHRGADKLASSLGLPVVFAQCKRLRRGAYEVSFHPISEPSYVEAGGEAGGEAGQEILERYVRTAETMIGAQPETYLWTNRRWKKTPPEDEIVAGQT
ncbi:MAG: hypothetical protein Cons2KO_15000 [Congregibacter sp.]